MNRTKSDKLSRRNLIRAGIAASSISTAQSADTPETRQEAVYNLRMEAATAQKNVQAAVHSSNGDESSVPRYAAAFSKGLPHGQTGQVDPAAYRSLLAAIQSGKNSDFERISRGSGRRLVSPQAAFAYHLEGADSHTFTLAAPPPFTSREAAVEMEELYWQALCRDIPFAEFDNSPLVRRAASALGAEPASAFRGPSPGDNRGPYISQFLLKPVPVASTMQEQRYRSPLAANHFLDTPGEWLQLQTGVPPWRDYRWDPVPRYIRNGRDLAEYVHYDYLCQAFINAALIMMDLRPETVLSDRRVVMQPNNPYKKSVVQDGFVTFGIAEVIDWLGRVKTAALKAAWYQKWVVHRRLRPEEFGGRVHHTRSKETEYPIHASLLASPALDEVYSITGTYFLPQAYPEGAPLHPSYPSGHATVAGASSVVLKAFFDEDALIPDCVHASAAGDALLLCPESFVPTFGAEVDKLAFNIANGRNWAGIHYRSDAIGGIRLGEEVGISILRDLVRCCHEDFAGFAFTRYDGTPVRISRTGELS